MIRIPGFFFYPCWKRRLVERDRQMDWMTLPLILYSTFYVAWKRETWIPFAFWIGQRWRLKNRRCPENKGRIKEKEREKKRLRTEPTMLDWHVSGTRYFSISLFRCFSLFLYLIFYFLFASIKLLWYESRNHAYRHSTWIHCCCSNERWKINLDNIS